MLVCNRNRLRALNTLLIQYIYTSSPTPLRSRNSFQLHMAWCTWTLYAQTHKELAHENTHQSHIYRPHFHVQTTSIIQKEKVFRNYVNLKSKVYQQALSHTRQYTSFYFSADPRAWEKCIVTGPELETVCNLSFMCFETGPCTVTYIVCVVHSPLWPRFFRLFNAKIEHRPKFEFEKNQSSLNILVTRAGIRILTSQRTLWFGIATS